MNVLSVQSHVAFGSVGNAAAVFPLQRLGINVWPVPTVLFSNHPGYGDHTGEICPPTTVAAILTGLERRGAYASCDGAITGYFGEPAQVGAAAEALRRLRQVNARAVYLCDPVLGDEPKGLYVARPIADAIAARLIGLADVAMPNAFELAWLTQRAVGTVEEAIAAADALRTAGPRIVVVSGIEAGGDVVTLACTAEGACTVTTPIIPAGARVDGAGDLLAALWLARYLESNDPGLALSLAVSSTFGVIAASAARGVRELALVATQTELVDPSRRFAAKRIR
jgi:pyridoxine kinase